jgi:hypothetical protein
MSVLLLGKRDCASKVTGETALQIALSMIVWASLGVFLVGLVVVGSLLPSSYRLALGTLFLANFGGFVFSFLTGFSIGRFTVVLPLVATAFAVTYARSWWLQVFAYVAAIATYLVLAWLIIGISWRIPIELPLCFFAYVVAFLLPPPTSPTVVTRGAG